MANVKWTEFPAASTISGSDLIPIVQSGTNKKATGTIFSTYIGTLFVSLSAEQTIAGVKTFSSQLASSVATGTAPFSIASTTKVTNLNADLLDGYTSADFQLALTNPITGTGTTNYLPKFTGTSALGNSLIYDDGTNIGIGTATPETNLQIVGNTFSIIRATSTSGVQGIDFGLVGDSDAGRLRYNPTTHTISLFADNAERLSLTSTELITFGATDTGEAHIFGGSARVNGALVVKDSGYQYIAEPTDSATYGYLGIGHFTNGTFIGTTAGSNSASDLLRFGTSGTERMRITSSGNVGIGDSNPLGKLVVSGSSASGSIMSIDTSGTTSFIRLLADISSQNLLNWQTGTDFRFATSTQAYGSFSEKMRITSAGLVGIGTASPAGQLDVGSGYQRLLVTYPSTYVTKLSIGAGAFIQQDASNEITTFEQTYSAGKIDFNIGAGSTKVRIANTGNVLIGTTTDAGYKLDVNGTARVNGMTTIVSGIGTGLNFKFSSGYGNSIIGLNYDSGADSGNSMYFGVNNAAGSPVTALTLYGTGAATFSGIARFNGDYVSFNNNGYIRCDATNILSLQMGSSGFRVRNAGDSATFFDINTSGAATFSSSVGTTLGSGGLYLSGDSSPDLAYIGYNYTNINGTESVIQSARSSWRNHFGNGATNSWKVGYRAANAAANSWTDYLTIANSGVATFNSGTTNQNTTISGSKVGMSRTSDGAEVVYFSKNTDLGAEGTANINGYNGIQFRTQGAESVKVTIKENGNLLVNKTTDEGYKLDVFGTTRLDPQGGEYALVVGRASGMANIRAGYDDGGYLLMDSAGAGGMVGLNWYSSENVILANGGGKVGIGNSSPQTILSVNAGDTQNTLYPIVTSQSSTVTYGGLYAIRDDSGDQRGLVFQTYTPNVGLNEAMRITSLNQLSVGTSTPDASAKVQIDSNTQGFLVPRMGEGEINSISSPAAGLLVYNTDQNHMCMYDGSVWKKFSMSNM